MRQRIDEACLGLEGAEEWEESPNSNWLCGMVGPDQKFREAVGRCIAEACLADAEEEERKRHMVSCKDYFDLAVTYSWDVPDPAWENVSAGEVLRFFCPTGITTPGFEEDTGPHPGVPGPFGVVHL